MLLNVNGEKLSLDEVEVMLHCDESADNILDHGYCMNQFFNTGETVLNHKMLPNKTLAAKTDRFSGAKKCKEYVTVLTCVTASGSFQLPLIVIGKSVKSFHCSYLPTVFQDLSKTVSVFLKFFEGYHTIFPPFIDS